MTIKYLFCAFISFICSAICYGQKSDSIINYLNFPESINFENKIYTLVSSSNSSPDHYLQEYIRKGDTNTIFNTKIYFEVLTGGINVTDIVSKKITALENLRGDNTIVDHKVYKKDGAVMLHFMISKISDDRQSVISSSRYVNLFKIFLDKTTGKKGVILFGFSANSRGEDYDDPEIAINAMRKHILKDVAAFDIPEVRLNN
jgi:hypothetical protein